MSTIVPIINANGQSINSVVVKTEGESYETFLGNFVDNAKRNAAQLGTGVEVITLKEFCAKQNLPIQPLQGAVQLYGSTPKYGMLNVADVFITLFQAPTAEFQLGHKYHITAPTQEQIDGSFDPTIHMGLDRVIYFAIRGTGQVVLSTYNGRGCPEIPRIVDGQYAIHPETGVRLRHACCIPAPSGQGQRQRFVWDSTAESNLNSLLPTIGLCLNRLGKLDPRIKLALAARQMPKGAASTPSGNRVPATGAPNLGHGGGMPTPAAPAPLSAPNIGTIPGNFGAQYPQASGTGPVATINDEAEGSDPFADTTSGVVITG